MSGTAARSAGKNKFSIRNRNLLAREGPVVNSHFVNQAVEGVGGIGPNTTDRVRRWSRPAFADLDRVARGLDVRGSNRPGRDDFPIQEERHGAAGTVISAGQILPAEPRQLIGGHHSCQVSPIFNLKPAWA